VPTIESLFSQLQKPALWQRTPAPFWDDEHISKGMLEAHLNPDWDAASRKHETIDRSVKWLVEIIPPGGKILDLGCGPGLYTKRLSEMGYDTTGMDFSKRSIAHAKSQDAKTKYILENYLELDAAGEFDAVILIYCDYAALTPDERRLLLPKISRALKPGGLFVLDVFSEKIHEGKNESKSWTFHPNGGFWNAGPHLCLEAVYLYENNTVKASHYVVATREKVTEHIIWDTAYTVQKMANEVSPFGFQIKGVFDDACGSAHTPATETLCFILETINTVHFPRLTRAP